MIRFYGARREYPAAGKDFIFENDVLISPRENISFEREKRIG
jgi:hypothetical protein